ncbi:hypothetical protein L1787_21575 [Acuticoccus sp. M5D2P5]|uniref:hypothetical protein n=1 Tax=Acuticoccus kalidii TaxID=2910977 RepID=UPI001F2C7153|nr:hypothetical protein [Acuticoccus kalidii]MCF3935984.1 hypothetical protein [Acuticoccus kalidii]
MEPYFEAQVAPEAQLPYVANVSWPRSGHHLFVRLLHGYFGDRFGYCEYHVPRHRPDLSCCAQAPCGKGGPISMSKNHDFELDMPVPETPFVVQYREPLAALESEFELFVRNGNPDNERAFAEFARKRARVYRAFTAKWVEPDMPQRTLVDYAELVADPVGTLRRMLPLWGEREPDETRLAQTIQSVPHVSVRGSRVHVQPKSGVLLDRNVEAFRYYDAAFFDELRHIALEAPVEPLPQRARRTELAKPAVVRANKGKRRFFAYVHIQKTAGTSMRAVLRELFGPQQVFWHGEDGILKDAVEAQGEDFFERYRLVGGHFDAVYPTVCAPNRPLMILGMTRDPFEQIISHYEYVYHRPENPLHTTEPLIDLLEADARFAQHSRNIQCRMLSAKPRARDAMTYLTRRPCLLGTVPASQAFVDTLADILNKPTRALPRINAGSKGYEERYGDPKLRALIDRISLEDRMLVDAITAKGGVYANLRPRSGMIAPLGHGLPARAVDA